MTSCCLCGQNTHKEEVCDDCEGHMQRGHVPIVCLACYAEGSELYAVSWAPPQEPPATASDGATFLGRIEHDCSVCRAAPGGINVRKVEEYAS